MSEQQPEKSNSTPGNTRVILFMVVLSFVCAFILSILASALAEPKEVAKDLDRSRQMLIAAKVLDYSGTFLMKNEKGEYIPAKFTEGGILVPGTGKELATNQQILEIYKNRFIPLLADDKGNITTFQKAGFNEDKYTADYKKTGYSRQPYKLFYEIKSNPEKGKGESAKDGVVIPINGFGLWDAIYGYLALKPDANTVIGITWYDQKETPGLGANISEEPWQNLFPGKKIFLEGSSGKTDFKIAPLGVVVVKGKVSEVLGDSPKAKSAVDGMAGATLTGNGVTDAYRDVLNAYRPFLIKLHDENAEGSRNSK